MPKRSTLTGASEIFLNCSRLLLQVLTNLVLYVRVCATNRNCLLIRLLFERFVFYAGRYLFMLYEFVSRFLFLLILHKHTK